jgi:hypothetical protein
MINKKKMDESDNLYLEKARLLDELQLIEAENNKCLQEIDQRLLDLDPDQRNEYEQIKEIFVHEPVNRVMELIKESFAKAKGQ